MYPEMFLYVKQLRTKYEAWNQELSGANATLQKKLKVEKAESEKMKAELETGRESTPMTEAGRNSEERTEREGKRRMKAVVEIPLKPAKVSGEMAAGSRAEAKRRAADESESVKLGVQERIELDQSGEGTRGRGGETEGAGGSDGRGEE